MTGAWYAAGGPGRWRDFWTLLHIPYTSMVLAYTVIGASLAPDLDLSRLGLLLLAYVLGLGIGAHFLDEARGHPWKTGFSTAFLVAVAAVSLAAASAIGVHLALEVSLWLLGFVLAELLFALAYNLEWFGGRFHTDIWFAVSWGALPLMTSAFVQDPAIPLWLPLVAAGAACTAGIQISLSRWVKGYRRGRPVSALRFSDSSESRVDTEELVRRPQRALKLVVAAVDLLALGLLLRRLL